MAATLDRKRIAKPNWNGLLRQILVRAMKRLRIFEELQKRCPVTIIRGERGDAGYRYLRKADISVQASDTNRACRALVTVAQDLGMAIEIDFMWLQKEGAARPGGTRTADNSGAESRNVTKTTWEGYMPLLPYMDASRRSNRMPATAGSSPLRRVRFRIRARGFHDRLCVFAS